MAQHTVATVLAAALKRHGVTDIFGQSLPSALFLATPDEGIRQIAYRTENAAGATVNHPDEYKIGTARLGGFNGIPSVPTFNMPFDPETILDIDQAWYATAGALILVYVLLRVILASPFGRVVVAVKENEVRASLLGYDPRLIKLLAFVIGGAVAGLGGALYVNWGAFVGPTIFSLSLSAEIIIWITVGGLGTLLGPVVGCFIIQYIVAQIGSQQAFNSNLVLGAILIAFVLLLPQGLIPTFRNLFFKAVRLLGDSRRRTADEPARLDASPVGAE